MSVAVVAWSLRLAPQRLTWRRPVVDEFWRFARIAGPSSLGVMLIAGALVGAGLVGQAVFWLERVGQRETIVNTLLVLLIREFTPIVVGLVTLGRAGLTNIAELATMRADGTVRALAAQGLDPFVLLVLPRVLALGLCTLAHAVLFLVVAIGAGWAFGQIAGIAQPSLVASLLTLTRVLGEVGVLVVPVKTLLIGFALAATTAVTALHSGRPGLDGTTLGRGFFRSLLALFTVSLLCSALL